MARLTKLDPTGESVLRRIATSPESPLENNSRLTKLSKENSIRPRTCTNHGGRGIDSRPRHERTAGFVRRYRNAFHGSEAAVRTVLQDLEMLPQDVAHEGRGTCQKGFLAHGTNLFAGHVLPWLHRHTLQREFTDGPVQPVGDSCFRPLPRVWKTEEESETLR